MLDVDEDERADGNGFRVMASWLLHLVFWTILFSTFKCIARPVDARKAEAVYMWCVAWSEIDLNLMARVWPGSIEWLFHPSTILPSALISVGSERVRKDLLHITVHWPFRHLGICIIHSTLCDHWHWWPSLPVSQNQLTCNFILPSLLALFLFSSSSFPILLPVSGEKSIRLQLWLRLAKWRFPSSGICSCYWPVDLHVEKFTTQHILQGRNNSSQRPGYFLTFQAGFQDSRHPRCHR